MARLLLYARHAAVRHKPRAVAHCRAVCGKLVFLLMLVCLETVKGMANAKFNQRNKGRLFCCLRRPIKTPKTYFYFHNISSLHMGQVEVEQQKVVELEGGRVKVGMEPSFLLDHSFVGQILGFCGVSRDLTMFTNFSV